MGPTSGHPRRRLIADVYSRAAPTYDRCASSYHAHYASSLVQRACLRSTDTVLDLACGTGAILAAAAPLLDDGGQVIGVDIAAGMAAVADQEIRKRGNANAHVAVMDAEHLGFRPHCFDAVFCAFAMHIVPDPESVIAEVRRVLRAGGTFALSAWAEEDPNWDWERQLFDSFRGSGSRSSRDLSPPGAVANMLSGWHGLSVDCEDYLVHLSDENEWWAWKWSYGIRHALEQLDDEALARLKDAGFKRMQAQRTPAGFPVRLRAWLATAQAPPALGTTAHADP